MVGFKSNPIYMIVSDCCNDGIIIVESIQKRRYPVCKKCKKLCQTKELSKEFVEKSFKECLEKLLNNKNRYD